MDKKWNKWLIIGGIAVIILHFLLGALEIAALSIITGILLSIAALAIPFGIINYTSWNIWIKLLVTIVGSIVLYYLIFGLVLLIFLP